MKNENISTSNKKNAGKGNGNSIISHKSANDDANDNVKDYVSGDFFPSSRGHNFSQNHKNKGNKSDQ